MNLPVGQNLQDHLLTVVGPFVFDEKVADTFNPFRDANLENLLEYATTATGPLTAAVKAIPNVGYYNTPNSVNARRRNWPDIQYYQMASGLPDGVGPALEQTANIKAKIFEDYIRPVVGRDAHLIVQALARPYSRGEIKLAGIDPFKKPIIQPNYLEHEKDRRAMIDGK